MKKLRVFYVFLSVGAIFLIILSAVSNVSAATSTILSDTFDGTIANSSLWHIPTWVSSTDGTFIGRTQFRVTQNSSLPTLSSSNVNITVQSYNPTGFSFYGTDLISNQIFTSGSQGIDIVIRAKMNTPLQAGTVGGIFLYALKPGSNTLHDEIDFELLGNQLGSVQTNVYANEPLGAGHPISYSYPSGTATDYHTYEIKWLPTQVLWYIDGTLVRTENTYVPAGPMYLHLNMWAPDNGWANAYSAAIQPTSNSTANQIFTMSVDSVNVQQIVTQTLKTITVTPGSSSLSVTPIAIYSSAEQLTASTLDQNGSPITAALTWKSSNPAVATVSSTGFVTAVSSGTTTITASSGSVTSNSAAVTIISRPVVTLKVTPVSSSLVVVPVAIYSSAEQFTAAGYDSFSTIVPVTSPITWKSSNPAVASISSTGFLTAVAPGTATITAVAGSITSAPATVTVMPRNLTSLNIWPVTSTLSVTPFAIYSSSEQPLVNALDQFGVTMAVPALTWKSSNTAVVTVSATGLVSAVGPGSATITVASGSITSTPATVTIIANPGIQITSVPKINTSGNAVGAVTGIGPSGYLSYNVAVYIKVAGGWWTKPYMNAPATAIQSNGTWSANVTTGGSDTTATEIRAYLVPKTFSIPLMGGGTTLPATLAPYVYASVLR